MNRNIIKMIENNRPQRFLYWDEEDRLQAMKDDDNSSYYFYDYAGERTWKIVGPKVTTTFNGQTTSHNVFNESTLYLFPEVTVTKEGYTKHIFAGTERICSKIGKGGINTQNVTISLTSNEINDKRAAQKNLIKRVYTNMCFVPPPPLLGCMYLNGGDGSNTMNFNLLKNKLDSLNYEYGAEVGRYYYTSDHLGSSAWITNAGGAIQYLSYDPWGSIITNQKATGSTFDTDYKHSGKPLDLETNYYYYGARYYDPALGIWLSVDPMAAKFPFISSYAYCLNSPVNFIDPDGRDVVVTGEASEKYVSQLQTKNLTITRNESTGLLSYTGKAKTATEKTMVKAMNSKSVTVNICAENTNSTEHNGDNIQHNGGGFLGTNYSNVNGKESVGAFQHVNPNVLEKMGTDTGLGAGMFARHELTESYEAGMMSLDPKSPYYQQSSSHSKSPQGSVYNQAHSKASFVPDLITVPQQSLKIERGIFGFPMITPKTTTKFQVAP